MAVMTKDARGFVEGVVAYIKKEGKAPSTLPKVQSLLTKVSRRAAKEDMAFVEAGVALTQPEKQEVARFVASLVGHSVRLETKVNRHLVGGLRITVGDWVVDTSLRTQLEQLAAHIA